MKTKMPKLKTINDFNSAEEYIAYLKGYSDALDYVACVRRNLE
jgi:hypothetical protein